MPMYLQDSFYRRHSPEDLKLAFANRYDFDHPGACLYAAR